jgi:protein tyrosine phosphatase
MPTDFRQRHRGLVDMPSSKQGEFAVTANHQMTVFEQVIIASPGTADITVTLPSVVEAIDKMYSIYVPAVGASGTVTIVDKNGDGGLADIVLYSDGFRWWTLVDVST